MPLYTSIRNYAKYLMEKCLIYNTFPLSLYINRHLALPSYGAPHNDGWGEGFEQREIEVDKGGSVCPSVEQRQLEHPDGAGAILSQTGRWPAGAVLLLQSTGQLICIKRGEAATTPQTGIPVTRSRMWNWPT